MATMMRELFSEPAPVDDEAPILSARCVVPRLPDGYVDRPRLSACLDRGAALPLTVVSAPAGTGKTAMAAAWVADRQARHPSERIGWVSFASGDERPNIFWPLVAEGLRREGVLPPGELPDDPSRTRRRMLSALGSALAELSEPMTLVLDGYEIADADLAAGLEYLLGHSGGRLRLVILTRVDPVLPLHRFRLSGEVAELRMADLAFTERESADLVRGAGIALQPDSMRALHERTRGWAAGLRFATMMLEDSADLDATLTGMTGDTGNIAAYLMAEIVQRQRADVRDVLLRTSVVEVLEPGLTERLGGRSAGRTLAAMTHDNVLVETVPGATDCYRYHPLLRELLSSELAQGSPARLASQRRRARAWYAEQSLGTGPETARVSRLHVVNNRAPSQITAWSGPVVERLTERELEVLQYLDAFLDTREIAATMVVSVNTVRTHVRNILRKLAVNRRSDAVRRARALDLLGA